MRLLSRYLVPLPSCAKGDGERCPFGTRGADPSSETNKPPKTVGGGGGVGARFQDFSCQSELV